MSATFTPKSSEPGHLTKYLTFVIDIPFKAVDARKYLRFQSWVLEKEGQLVPFEVPNNMMTGSQMREEGAEFEKLYRLNKLAREKGVADAASAYSEYQKGVYTSEMKQKATGDGAEL